MRLVKSAMYTIFAVVAGAVTVAAAPDSACTLTWQLQGPYARETEMESRTSDNFQLVVVKQRGRVVQVWYGLASAADRTWTTQFSADPSSYLVRRGFIRHERSLTRLMLSHLGCGTVPQTRPWRHIGSVDGYNYVEVTGPACNYRLIMDPSGSVVYHVVTRNGVNINYLGSDIPYGWRPENAAYLFRLECRARDLSPWERRPSLRPLMLATRGPERLPVETTPTP